MTALLLMTSFLPHRDGVVRDSVDVTELNHLCDKEGKLVLEQLIWWRWSHWQDAYRVVDWRLLNKAALPEKVGNRCVTRFYDEKTERFREVRSRVFKLSWTTTDPEIEDRVHVAESQRRGLRK